MNRQLYLINRLIDWSNPLRLDGRHYVCAGNDCEQCKLRFNCFTEDEATIFEIDWHNLHEEYAGSPTTKLQALTGSIVHSVGSKRYVQIVESLQRYDWSTKAPISHSSRIIVL